MRNDNVARAIAAARREPVDPRAKARVRQAIAVSIASASVVATASASAGKIAGATIAKVLAGVVVVASVGGGALWIARSNTPVEAPPVVVVEAPVAAPIVEAPPPSLPPTPRRPVATKPRAPVAPPPAEADSDSFAVELAALEAAQAALRVPDYAKADALARTAMAQAPRSTFSHELLFVRAVAACGLGVSNPHLATLRALDTTLHARAAAHCERITK